MKQHQTITTILLMFVIVTITVFCSSRQGKQETMAQKMVEIIVPLTPEILLIN